VNEAGRRAFIRANTILAAPPLAPELRLHLASEVTPLWQATEEVLAEGQVPPPYWAFAWPGGQALARHLLDHQEIVAGRRVLDFGAGSGIGAIAAARAGAAASIAAEIDPFAAAAITLNAAANGVAVAVECRDLIGAPGGNWPVVVVGDMCYERPLAERLTGWLRGLAQSGAMVLLGDPGRAYLPRAGLAEIARHTVPTSRDLEDRDSREAVIWRLAG
jgi:predicted nicotinamide N-methyase